MSTRDDKIALVQRLMDNAIDDFCNRAASLGYPDPTIEDFFQHVRDSVNSPGVGASLVGYEPVNTTKLTPEQIHRLACAPLPRIRTVRSVSRWAGSSHSHRTLEDGRIPQALRLDELDGDE